MSAKRPGAPSFKAIAQAWNKDLEDIAHCFACGYTGTGKTSWGSANLSKAHVVPFSLGGSNDPNNFVLLCWVCHQINPETPSREHYLTWLNAAPKSKAYLEWIALGKIRDPAARTREGMAQRKAQGVRLGRPVVMAEETRTQITELRNQGMSLRAIAQELNEAGVPTAHGGSAWHASTVSKVLATA
jgi:hypothetical protein